MSNIKFKDEFNVEINILGPGKRFRWVIIKSFDESDASSQYEREYNNANPDTSTRLKTMRVQAD